VALVAFAGGPAPCGCAPERLPSWPSLDLIRGLTPPSTRRRLKDEADIAATSSKSLQNKHLRPCRCVWAFVAPNHVEGRDNPRIKSGDGQDALFCRRRSFPNSAFPASNS
jgi:hypothetical protein